MIDLSHLTEEEQGVIMAVLMRDDELKKAEEERIRRLEPGDSQPNSKLKYLTGEWFYEAKSRRHMDTIHGSEIILASMKQRKAGSLDVPSTNERLTASSSRGSEVGAPRKPARCLEALQQAEMKYCDAEKENLYSAGRSPRTPRHNPFNNTSLTVGESTENTELSSKIEDQETSDKELMSAPKTGETGQISGGSATSEGSSAGFRPVPKRRLFLSRRSCSQSESNGPDSDPQLGSITIVPAPRLRLQRGSSGSSNQSNLRDQDETLLKSVATGSNQVDPSAQPNSSVDENSQQPTCDVTKVLSNSSLDGGRNPPSLTSSRPDTFSRSDASVDSSEKNKDSQTQGGHAAGNTVPLLAVSIQDYDSSSSVATSRKQEELSLPQSSVDADPPVSYDLYFIESSDQQTQKKSNQNVFKLSTQTSSPTGDEEDSIAKVLDWFSRSTDSNDWLNAADGPEVTKTRRTSNRHAESNAVGSGQSLRKDGDGETPEMKRSPLQTNKAEDEEVKQDARERSQPQEEKGKEESVIISKMKSFWEKSSMYPKVAVSKSTMNKPVDLPAEEDEEKVIKPSRVSDVHCPSGGKNGKDVHGVYVSNEVDESEEKDFTDRESVNLNNHQESDSFRSGKQQILAGQKCNDDQTIDNGYLKLAASRQEAVRRDSDTEVLCQARLNQSLSSVRPNSQTPLQEELSKLLPLSQPETDLKERDSPDHLSANKRDMQSSMSPKRADRSNKDRAGSPHARRLSLSKQESTAEMIKQLKSFWEQERKNPMFYTGKPKALGDGKAAHGAKLNKRFTKSEYDLTSIGNHSGNDEEDSNRNHQRFTVLPLNQRIDKVSPSLSSSRTQFNTLREFWDEAASNSKGSLSFDKPKSPTKKEPTSAQHPPQDLMYGELVPQRETKRSSKDSGREEKTMKPQSNLGKETRSLKNRKDSFNNSSGRNSLRRATSMFSLNGPKENGQFKVDVGPVHSQSRKQGMDRTQSRGQSADKGALLGRLSEETEKLSPRARAFVPRDYRHYLGMTDKTSVHTSLDPTVKEEEPEGKAGYQFDMVGPLRASTPVGSEERNGKKVSKTNQQWANYSSSETGQDSSVSSTSDTWSDLRIRSKRDEDAAQNPVRKALRRAEARPKNQAKSMEDITAPLSPRQDRRQEPTADMRRISDVSSTPSSYSSLHSDPEHLKTMSKSVPSFLQKEDDDRDTDSSYDSYYRGSLTTGIPLTNLSSSSGMAAMSPLSGSVMTMYSGDFRDVEVRGNVHFSIHYVQKLREFHIFVAECVDLAAVDSKRGRSDPYVKSYLVPDKDNLGKRKTSVKKKTLNPTFNEILRYRVHMDYLRTQVLILSVWHHDTFGRNSFLGEVDVDLSKYDFDHTRMNYLALKAKTTPTPLPSHGRGEMRLAIRYLPDIIHTEGSAKEGLTNGEIHIWVKDCKNLPPVRATIDPYVKCFMLPDTSRKNRQKTRVLRRTVEPVFNHTMVYDGITEADLREACVELTVWDRDRLASNLLGGLRLGVGAGRSYGAAVTWMDSTPYEAALWERMMASPNEWVEDVLPLRILNSARTAFK